MKIHVSFLLSLIFVLIVSGCFRSSKNTAIEYGNNDFHDEQLYALYPQLLDLQEKLDEASAYYYLGDISTSLQLSSILLVDIIEMKTTSPAPYVCGHLDSLENLASVLQQRIIEEETESDWQNHVSSVLDSIASCHVVEEEIEVVMNWKTEHWMKYFQGKGRRYFTKWLTRVEVYREIIEPVLVSMDLPRDLIFLAVIESGLNLNARSNVNATGPWQFMAGTGRLFGLRINWWIDERKDIVASTYAAGNYLNHLHNLFGNWQLALAGYNSGEYRVARAISTQKTDDYWKLRLPNQTKWFVPKFMAALTIGRDPSAYGFEIPETKPFQFDVITIDKSTDLRIIAKSSESTLTGIKKLNPALKRWATPPGMVIELKVPYGTGNKVIEALSRIPAEERVSWLRHSIRKGETISVIARKYEISQSELKRINGIKNVHRIRIGQTLMIPTRDNGDKTTALSNPSYRKPPSKLPKKINIKKYKPPAGHTKMVYTVRKKDTLSEIAERFGVGLSKLRRWNNLRYKSMIHPGKNLVIYLPPGSGVEYGEGLSSDSGSVAEGKKKHVHIVLRGETLTSICRKYQTRMSDVLAWNRKMNKNRLFPGDRITLWLESN
ncbi:MAG: LysM peptidoglycan-binding domain-containing protein [Bacteroidales bacterium]|nr:LysM peptidoglycan-binding domain-containing protein [Candidatus Latescibacterota bacterium]